MPNPHCHFKAVLKGYDTDGDDYSGSFVDFGLFSVFEGIVETKGVYEFVEDPSHQEGGYYATTYTISDEFREQPVILRH